LFSSGQESAGIVTSDGGATNAKFHSHKGMGLVSQVFKDDPIHRLKGNLGIGKHNFWMVWVEGKWPARFSFFLLFPSILPVDCLVELMWNSVTAQHLS
jgi:hypothetical protein